MGASFEADVWREIKIRESRICLYKCTITGADGVSTLKWYWMVWWKYDPYDYFYPEAIGVVTGFFTSGTGVFEGFYGL